LVGFVSVVNEVEVEDKEHNILGVEFD